MLEQEYQSKIESIEKKLRAVTAENSEIKAKQLINTFQNQGLQGSGATSVSESETKKNEEIQKLYQQISQQTNQILQLQDDKEDLLNKLEDLQNSTTSKLPDTMDNNDSDQAAENL